MVESSLLIAVIVGLGELWKKIFGNKIVKVIPLINLALGVTGAIVYSGLEVKMAVFQGILIGLSASGLYSGSKNVKEGLMRGDG